MSTTTPDLFANPSLGVAVCRQLEHGTEQDLFAPDQEAVVIGRPTLKPTEPTRRAIGVPRCRLHLVREESSEYVAASQQQNAANLARFLAPMLDGEAVEVVLVVALDTKLFPIGVMEIGRGTINQSLLSAASVYRFALLANAFAVVVAHNHPSGDPTPSRPDHIITSQIRRAGELLGIKLADHIIIGSESRFYSFADAGTLYTD